MRRSWRVAPAVAVALALGCGTEASAGPDGDGDGFAEAADCDDADPTVWPGAERACAVTCADGSSEGAQVCEPTGEYGPCRCLSGEGVDAGSPPDGGPPDAGPACDAPLTCYPAGGGSGTAPCRTGPPRVGSCAPDDWDYCECDGGGGPWLFLIPPAGSGLPLEHVVVVGSGLSDLRLKLRGDYCAGGGGLAVCDAEGDCAGGGLQIFHWDVSMPDRDALQITVYQNDTDVPCDLGPGESELFSEVRWTRD